MVRRAPLLISLSLLGCSDRPTADDAGETADTTGDGDAEPLDCADPRDPNATIVLVGTDIDADTTWTCDNIYRLAPDASVFVRDAVLTIEPGTTILGDIGSALIIEKDARIEASGSPDAPIVFTSAQAEPAPGDWGGLVLLGAAVNNLEGDVGLAEGIPGAPTYGGDDDSHDCGTLQYVRVEYAGYAVGDLDLDSISFYSCGSQTTVNHVQAHMAGDDGIAVFGGTFDLDHIVVTGAHDDSIEVDQGYRGVAQYLFIQQHPKLGDNCFEVSN